MRASIGVVRDFGKADREIGRPKADAVSACALVLADVRKLEAARDALPGHSHIASLFELTLDRLRQEAAAIRRVELLSAA